MSKPLESLMRQAGLVSEPALRHCLEQSRKRNLPLADVLISEGHLTEEALADALSRLLKLPRVRIANSAVDPEALKKLPDKTARKHACLPLSIEGRTLVVAMVNPADYLAIQDIEFASALSVKPVVATRSEILDGIEERYDPQDRIGEFLANVPDVSDLQIVQDDSQQDLGIDVADADAKSASDAPVVKMVNLVVYDALKAGASDLHIEPTLHDVQVRMRVDGVLRDYTRVPKWLHGPVVSRLKILARLDIAERRLPQDGRISVNYQGRAIDIRVSTLPTHFGEKLVLRILGGSSLPKIEKLGFDDIQTASIEASIGQPQGIILITGPTGSGKTTTLYAMLARRRSPEVNIVTVEDPIEYQLPGINQVQVNPKAGLNFAGVLRSILRQDPDVILVGELRDQETAEVAFQAAMTGHLVLTTLHTNSAAAAIPRLFDLEVDPSILSTSLTLVIAQRLVRRVCESCRESYVPDVTTASKVGLPPGESAYRGRGCPACGGTGYTGRIGIYEFFRPTAVLRKLIHQRSGELDLRNAARQGGMKSLREDALIKIRSGITSPDEVLRVVQIDETEVPCPNCGAPIETDFSTCPYCLYSIKVTCQGCGQELKPGWKACPYCHTQSSGATSPEARESEATPPQEVPAAAKPIVAKTPLPEPDQEMITITGKVIGDMPEGTDDDKFTNPGAGLYPGDVALIDFDDAADSTPATPESGRLAMPSASTASSKAADHAEPGEPTHVAAPEQPRHPRRRPPAGDLIIAANSGEVLNPDAVARAAASSRAATPAIVPPADLLPVDTLPSDEPPVLILEPPTDESRVELSAAPAEPVAESVPAAVGAPVAEPLAVEPVAPPVSAVMPAEQAPVMHAAADSWNGTEPPESGDMPTSRRLRVLVVDDDEDIRQVVAFTLRKLPVPVEVMTAFDGQDAVEQAEAAPPDLVVLDVMMPRMDGFETCRRLRQNVRTAFVPVLMLTASADEASRTKGYLVGTDDYMSKPFMPQDLSLRVSRLLRRTYGV